jgi:hypothetical protein
MSEQDKFATEQHFARVGAVAAVSGSLVLLVATSLHPMSADPNDPMAAFAEYAADVPWVGSHLGQFLGIALIGAALVAFAATLEAGKAAVWARVGLLGTAASVATAGALQSVDGVALKIMVDRWFKASGEARTLAFEGAFAVRQIEIGLASLLGVTFGLTAVVFGTAMLRSTRYPKWLAWPGLLGGSASIVAGVAQAYSGFSALAMNLSMPASMVLLMWVVALGVLMWRRAPGFDATEGAV